MPSPSHIAQPLFQRHYNQKSRPKVTFRKKLIFPRNDTCIFQILLVPLIKVDGQFKTENTALKKKFVTFTEITKQHKE